MEGAIMKKGMSVALALITIINVIALVLLISKKTTIKQLPTPEAQDTAYLREFIYNQEILIK